MDTMTMDSLKKTFLLALCKNGITLLEGTRDTVDEVDLAGVPASLAEAFQPAPSGKQLQFHSGTPSGTGMRAAAHDQSSPRLLSRSGGCGKSERREAGSRWIK